LRKVRSNSWNSSGWNRLERLNGGAAIFFCLRHSGPFAYRSESSPVARAMPADGLVSRSNWPGLSPVSARTARMTAGSRVTSTCGKPGTSR
jgi:hypothetical protein